MAKQIHILNGDVTVPEFQKSGIGGKIVVWREVLSDGPVSDPIQGDLFWDKRAQYIHKEFGGENYGSKMLAELDKLRDLNHYDEVVLWFEYDLFCQVNLLACLNFITHNAISLVCLGDELDGQLRGLGEILAKDFSLLYDQRSKLSPEDLAYAKQAWEAYIHDTPENLQRLPSSPTFQHLTPAVQAHLTRLPGKNGLNEIEQKMLLMIQDGVSDERKVVGAMLRDQGYFGLGDLQYFQYFNQLRSLVNEDKWEVNTLGKRILEGSAVFPQPNQYIGGVFRPDYFRSTWEQETN